MTPILLVLVLVLHLVLAWTRTVAKACLSSLSPPTGTGQAGPTLGAVVQTRDIQPSQGPISPDCAAGKCPCTGDAWDRDRDELVPCTHHCHQEGG